MAENASSGAQPQCQRGTARSARRAWGPSVARATGGHLVSPIRILVMRVLLLLCLAAVAVSGVVLGALYMLYMVHRVVWGKLTNPANEGLEDLTGMDGRAGTRGCSPSMHK